MLAKSLKYDLRAVYKLWLIFSLTLIGISVIGAFALRSLIISEEFTIFSVFSLGGVLLAVSAFSFYTLGVNILVFYRYYQNFFTDEAYLTFTLPVKRSTLLNSQLINSLFWSGISAVVTFVSLLIFLSIAPADSTNPELILVTFTRTTFDALRAMFCDIGGWLIIYIFLATLILMASFVFSNILILGCVTLGATMVRKYKLLMSILVYYAVNMGVSVLSYVLSIIIGITAIGSANALGNYSSLQLNFAMVLTLISVLMFFIVLSVLIYKFTLARIEKNLNLA